MRDEWGGGDFPVQLTPPPLGPEVIKMFDLFPLAAARSHAGVRADCASVLAGFNYLHNSFLFFVIVGFDSHVQFYSPCSWV